MFSQMMESARRVAIPVLAAMSLGGCVSVDGFGSRAITYNEHMKMAREDGVLRNILRSAFEEPLQFTEVSTVTGSAQGQGSIGGDLPLLGPARGGARLYSFSPAGQINGGPSFTVANLNSREFFNGLAAPVKAEAIAGLENAGYSPVALTVLLVDTITLQRAGGRVVLRNDPEDEIAYGAFISALNAMLESGLVLGVDTETSYIGPPLRDVDLASSAVLAELVKRTDGPELAAFDLSKPTPALSAAEVAELKAKGASVAYRLSTKERSVRFCFDTGYDTHSQPRPWPWADRAKPGIALFADSSKPEDERYFRIRPSVTLGCRADPAIDPVGDQTLVTKISYTTRSVRDAYGYLGLIIRIRESARATGVDARYLDAPIGKISPAAKDKATGNPPTADRYRAVRLFGVEAVVAPEKGVEFRGKRYRVTRFDAHDRSASIVAMLAELTALYSSAKDLPTPAVIPILQP